MTTQNRQKLNVKNKQKNPTQTDVKNEKQQLYVTRLLTKEKVPSVTNHATSVYGS